MNILILGITSWIGVRLSERLKENGCVITGTTRNVDVLSSLGDVKIKVCQTPIDYSFIIENGEFNIVVNLLRGEGKSDFLIHKEVLRSCCEKDVFYCYASSALALDGYPFGQRLTENLPVKSNTDYGLFKGMCETEIVKEKNMRSLILRFSSIQGWPIHKSSRNTVFFKKIISKERIYVDRGIVQNRLYDLDFVSMVARLLLDQKTGVYHLGASDASEEYDFLKGLAAFFGFDQGLVIAGQLKNVNANVVAEKFFKEYPNHRIFEKDTMVKLLSDAPSWIR